MNQVFLQSDFERFCALWQDTASRNSFVYDYFDVQTSSDEVLDRHNSIVAANNLGYGEKAFRYFWATVFSQFSKDVRFLEIGVYKGSILCLSQLIGRELGLNVLSYGVSPFNNTGDKYSVYGNEDYMECVKYLYGLFSLSLDNTRFITGLSTAPEVKKKLLAEEPFDIVYIDGGHDYETVISDLNLSKQILKIGGFLVMDDASSFLNFPPNHRGFVGHADVGSAIRDNLDTDKNYQHLFACGHNRIWKKVKPTS